MTLKHEGNDVRESYSKLPRPMRVGIEAIGSVKWFVNLMEELGIESLVGHPGETTGERENVAGDALGNVVAMVGGGQDLGAELYATSTGTLTATGNMISSGGVRSTLLPNGGVFIAQDIKAEIYDPASSTFALTDAYADPNPLLVNTATLPPDGMILVTGCAAKCTAGATRTLCAANRQVQRYGPEASVGRREHGDFPHERRCLVCRRQMIVGCRTTQKVPTSCPERSPISGTRARSTSSPQPHASRMERF